MASDGMAKKKVSSWPPSELGDRVLQVGDEYIQISGVPRGDLDFHQHCLDDVLREVSPETAERFIASETQLIRRLTRMVQTDVLTGLLNRRGLEDIFNRELALAKRTPHHPVACIFFDIDNFKQLNDKYDHATGDLCLEVAGYILREGEYFKDAATRNRLIRDTDIVSRYGGEEFVVVLSKVRSSDDALNVAERIRETFEFRTSDKEWLRAALNDLDYDVGLRRCESYEAKLSSQGFHDLTRESEEELKKLPLGFDSLPSFTISAGVYFFDSREEGTSSFLTTQTLVARADAAMYLSKNRGRNQVTLWKDCMGEGKNGARYNHKLSPEQMGTVEKK